jgi:protein SCO1/2
MKYLTLLGAVLLAIAGCSRGVGDRPVRVTGGADHAAVAAQPIARSSSLYSLHPQLVDQDGHPISLDVFRGHPVLVTMFYGSCRFACPMLISEVRRIEASLPPAARADLRVLLVSFDPDRDTPAALRAIADRMALDTSRWRLATAPGGDVRVLAAALGIQYRRLDNGEFMHSSVITALGRDGTPTAREDGIGEPDDSMRDEVLALH